MTTALMTTNGQFLELPLGKLAVWTGNARKTGAATGIEELAASIAAHGLMNPLTVRKAAKGRFDVVAGKRRFLALRLLAAQGALPKSAPVPCIVIEPEQDAAELSLAENVVRVAMHPADQFEAWRALAERGATAEQIATRFGVAAVTVRRRMALGRVSPKLLALYRTGDLSLEALQAYTLSDDHARQEAVYESLGAWAANSPHSVRAALTAAEIPARDKRVRFVGLEAYEAAGGAVRRDLFSEDGGFCQDAALLDRLVQEKLEAAAATVKTEGWHWTAARLSFDWADRQEFTMAECQYADRTDEEDSDDDSAPEIWPDAVKAVAGAVVYLGYDGAVEVERGLIRPDDMPPDEVGDDAADPGMDDQPKEEAPGLSATLIEDLTAHRTAALRAELAQSPAKALALVVYSLTAPMLCRAGDGILKLSLRQRSLDRSMDVQDSKAAADLALAQDRLADRLPGDAEALWEWCFAASQSNLLDVLAVVAAHGLDAVVGKHDPNRLGQSQGVALGQAMQLDMAQWYRPTAKGYFGKVSKAVILADLEAARQAPVAPAWAKLPKQELAALAEREVAATGWLPEVLS